MRRTNSVTNFLSLACFLCNISQIPALYDNRMLPVAYMVIWIFLACRLASDTLDMVLVINTCSSAIIFDLFCIVMRVFTGSGYISSGLFGPVNLSLFILIVGIMVGPLVDDIDLETIAKWYVASVMIVALYIYYNVFEGVDWAASGAFLYGAKNSAGQIFLTAIILFYLFFRQRYRLASIVCILFLGALIFMMKSRASIVACIAVLFIYFAFIEKRRGVRIIGLAVMVAVGIVVWKDPDLHKLFIDQIMLNNKDAEDITAVTSNRDLHFELFKQDFKYYLMDGTGGTYLESMPLAALLSYGLIGGSTVLLFSILPVRLSLKYIREIPGVWELAVLVLTLGLMMLFNGIFEERSPFGPGVKCYFLWLLTGIMIGRVNSGYYKAYE